MSPRIVFTFITLAVSIGSLDAQNLQRRADIRGGGDPNSGKCTIEVVVDGAADVEVRGDSAVLRNLNGQPPEWRRFECNSPMPANPANFRFKGVDGRGRQDLVRDPRQGGVAVVRISDPDNGREGYTFDLIWEGGNGAYTRGNGPYTRGNGPDTQGYPGPRQDDRGFRGGGRFTTEQAIQVCQDSIRQQVAERYRTNDMNFRRTNIDDNPGRKDWVVGSVEIRRRNGPPEVSRFSCSVNFDNGRVRSAQLDAPFTDDRRGPGAFNGGTGGPGGPRNDALALQNCQRSVESQVRRDGYDRVNFNSVRVDNSPGRNDWVIGEFRAVGRNGPEDLRFSCSVNLRDGDVRSVDIKSNRR